MRGLWTRMSGQVYLRLASHHKGDDCKLFLPSYNVLHLMDLCLN